MITDNTENLRCQSRECWGEIPVYLEETDEGETLCADCDNVLVNTDGLVLADEPTYGVLTVGA